MRSRLVLIALLATGMLPGTTVPATDGAAPAGRPAPAASAGAPATQRHGTVTIVSPRQHQTIHDNTGRVPVEVALRPPLDAPGGHGLRVMLDGRLQPGRWSATRFSLQGVDRGTHRLEVVVTGRAGDELVRSTAVEFHV